MTTREQYNYAVEQRWKAEDMRNSCPIEVMPVWNKQIAIWNTEVERLRKLL